MLERLEGALQLYMEPRTVGSGAQYPRMCVVVLLQQVPPAEPGASRSQTVFIVARQAAIATDPGECPFDNPSFGQDLKAGSIGSLHDLQLPCPCAPDDECHLSASVSTISKDAFDEGKHSSCPAQQVEGAITILNISRMNNDAQQEAQRVDQDVPLATFDLLARVVARRIEPRPPF